MLYGRYNFLCRLNDDAQLPCYKGSTFRGVFGRALKKVVCALSKQSCPDCLLKNQCVYALVFETSQSLPLSKNAKIASPPHPYVIEPPTTTEKDFKKGDSFDFYLLLFGDVNKNLPYFIYAFDQMGEIGIGKKINGKRSKFLLNAVKNNNEIIYSDIDKKLKVVDDVNNLTLKTESDFSQNIKQLKINFQTPLRLKFENHLTAELPFHVFVRALLRRVSSLSEYYDNGEPKINYKELVKKSQNVSIIKSSLNWFDWRRYSFRQDKAMLMGGIAGSIIYEGNIAEFMPFIDFCEKVHLGKQTSFGLGKFKADIL